MTAATRLRMLQRTLKVSPITIVWLQPLAITAYRMEIVLLLSTTVTLS